MLLSKTKQNGQKVWYNNILVTEKVEESESFLKDFRGTNAYKKHQEECTRWRANQNVHNILQIL